MEHDQPRVESIYYYNNPPVPICAHWRLLCRWRARPSAALLRRGELQEHCNNLQSQLNSLQESLAKTQSSLESERQGKEEAERGLEVKISLIYTAYHSFKLGL